MKRIIAIVLVVAVVVFSVAAVIFAASEEPSAARVGDSTISRSYFEDELQELAENETLQRTIAQAGASPASNHDGSVTSEIGAGWLGLMIAQKLAERAVERRGLEATADDEERARDLALQSVGGQEVFRSLPDWMRTRLLDRWLPVAVLESELQSNPSSALQEALAAQCPSGRYVSHILLESDVEAQAVLDELEGGADFADVAARESFDQGSAAQGGALGCIDGQEFVEPFATVAATQPIGEVSAPFTTEFGTHIVLVEDEPPPATLRAAALEQVLSQGRDRCGELEVDVNGRYGSWDCREGQVLPRAFSSQPAS